MNAVPLLHYSDRKEMQGKGRQGQGRAVRFFPT